MKNKIIIYLGNKVIPILMNRFYSKNNKSFLFRNEKYNYLFHEYSWATERVVEIPIVLKYLNNNKRVLELGNVLFQFVDKVTWDVIDKYELGKNVINEDIITWKPKEKYDLIISVSTLEHIGFNEEVGRGESFINKNDKNITTDAINNLKNNCLKPNGKLIATVPLGYNKEMDKKFLSESNKLGFDNIFFMKRVSRFNIWKEIKKEEIIEPEYGYPYPCANYISIGVYEK